MFVVDRPTDLRVSFVPGVSLITQVFYALVFLTRYTDLFTGDEMTTRWNHFFKIFYLLSSFYTIGIMRFLFPRTREREVAWKMSAAIFAGSLLASPFVMMTFTKPMHWAFTEVRINSISRSHTRNAYT